MCIQRFSIIALALIFHFNVQSQQRIGLDISSRMDNLMLTAHYQKVLKNRVLYSAGIFFGGNGRSFISNDTMRLYSSSPVRSPFPTTNRPVRDSITSYSLLHYNTVSRSVGIQAGIGYFFEFGVKHGLRSNVNATLGVVNSHVSGFYRSTENYTGVRILHNEQYFVGSINLEAYHTIRLTGRLTFNYGLKIPYYFSIDKAKFNPLTHDDLLSGFEPQLSIGMTRVIGKCD